MSRVLLVEDDASVRHFTARALALDGHEVTPVEDGMEGLDHLMAQKGVVDLVLSDIRMPEMDGVELAQAAAACFPHVPVLLMTGYAEQRERGESLANVVDVVTKPFSLSDIRAAVSRALGHSAIRSA
jgi:two-component system, cell cycle response regulator CpdR